MAQTTVLKALAGYFNTGENKKSLAEFSAELKQLTAEEKLELAQGVVAITGDTLTGTPSK